MDDGLLNRAMRGDRNAFTLLVKTYEQRLHRFACRMVGNHETAADIVQDAFINLWQARGRYTPQGADVAYLLRIVRNECIDHIRATRKREHVQIDSTLSSASSPHALAFEVGLNQALGAAVLRLPESQRVVFILSEYDGMTYQEIAEVLNCPCGTVASRKFAAAEALRKELRPWLEGGIR